MMDAFSDPAVEIITIMTSSQVGKTEIVNNIIGYHIEYDPSPMLLIMPTLEMGMAWSKDRFAPMLRDTPSLAGKVAEVRTRDSGNTILHKVFKGGHITIAGANSAASLASRPVRIVLFDEVDRFPPSAGSEGDPVKLGTKRTQTFWNRKILHTSTPTVKDVSRIESLWNESDQRNYFVPCPACGHFQKLVFAQVKFEKENLDSVRYECEKCSVQLKESDKLKMIGDGEWRIGRPGVKNHAGFHINELYSPWSSWRKIVFEFLEAKKRTETLKVWVNTTLGETWTDEESYSISDEKLASRVEDYINAPHGAHILTMGVDVQDDRLECLVKGWGKNDESWFIDYKTIYGSPGKDTVWKGLDEYLGREWTHESGVPMRIFSCCIDSLGHFTQNVYAFVKLRQHKRIHAIMGRAGAGRLIVGRPSKNNKFGVWLYPIGVDTAKELIFSRLQTDEPGPGYMHFNRKCDLEYFKQLTAEKMVIKFSKGFQHKVWVKVRSRNEALDCEVYALAAYTYPILNVDKAAIARGFENRAEKEPVKVKDEKPQKVEIVAHRIERYVPKEKMFRF
jgi:phage terminase large subunit GpA-like protein